MTTGGVGGGTGGGGPEEEVTEERVEKRGMGKKILLDIGEDLEEEEVMEKEERIEMGVKLKQDKGEAIEEGEMVTEVGGDRVIIDNRDGRRNRELVEGRVKVLIGVREGG